MPKVCIVLINEHPFDKTVRDANLFCWFRRLERVSFFVPAESEDCVASGVYASDQLSQANATYVMNGVSDIEAFLKIVS